MLAKVRDGNHVSSTFARPECIIARPVLLTERLAPKVRSDSNKYSNARVRKHIGVSLKKHVSVTEV